MKTLKIILASTLLTSVTAMAMTSKVKADENKVVYEVLTGDSSRVQGKSGLPVNVQYKSQHVDVGVSSDVNITISTGLSKGTLKVNVRALKEKSVDLEEKDLAFTLTKGQNTFPLSFQVTSQESGIHYINVTLSVEGEGSRVLVVPFKLPLVFRLS